MIRVRRFSKYGRLFSCAACFLLHPVVCQGAEKTRPNVVLILADDQGWGDLSASGNVNLSTPHVDSLARAGASLERFYVCPVCSPTRAEMLTGRYHTRMGVTSTSSGGERLSSDESTIGDTFKAATAYFQIPLSFSHGISSPKSTCPKRSPTHS